MNLMQFLRILKARYKVILITFGVIVLGTLLVSLVWPKKYTAEVDALLDVKITDPLSGAMTSSSPMLANFLATQIDIIKSERVAIRAIKLLKMDQNPDAIAQWREATGGRDTVEAWLANRFGASLDVKPARESNMVTISYSYGDPKFAALMANAFAQAYVDTTLDLRVEPARQSAGWFDERTRTLRDQLEKAQAKLSDYQREHGIVASDERLDVETARHAELSSQLTMIQGQKVDAETRQIEANGNIETSPDIMQNPVVQALRSDLAREESKLGELGAQLGKNHPQYKRSLAEIDSLRDKLNAEMKKVQSSMGAASNVSKQREAEIHAALAAQKKKMLDLKQQRDEIAVLMRDVDSAQRNYDTINMRLSQANLESQLNQTNVVILNPAREPLEASSPRIMRNLLIAVFLGTLLGVGMAFGLEMLDQRVYGAGDLEEGIDGIPLLGVLSPTRPLQRDWLKALQLALQRVLPKRFRLAGAIS